VSISHFFDVATPSPVAEVAAELRHAATTFGALEASTAVDDLLDAGAVTGAGTWVRVARVRPDPWKLMVAGREFTPTVTAAFQLDKVTDLSDQEDDMIRIVSTLLDRVSGDAVLHTDHEVVWLLRRDGELYLDDRDDLWPPARLSTFSRSCRRIPLSFTTN
jgi:hypothetical protein